MYLFAMFTTVYKLKEVILPSISSSFALIPKQLGCHAFDLRDVNVSILEIAHFTVAGENEAGVDLVLIQPFLLYYVNHVFLMLTSIF